MRVSVPIEDGSSSEAESGSSQEDSISGGDLSGSENDASSSGSESEASQVSVLELECKTVLVHRLSKDLPQGAQISFEQLLQQRQEGSLASKPYIVRKHSRQHPAGSSRAGSSTAADDFKRQNKNRPVEQSSKRPVPRHRQVVEVSNRYSQPLQYHYQALGCCSADFQTQLVLQ